MSQHKDKYQQQILFEEVDLKEQSKILPTSHKQVLFDNQDWRPNAAEIDSVEIKEEEVSYVEKRKPRWLWRIILSLLTVLVVIETIEFFTLGFSQSPLVASIYGAILFSITIVVGSTATRELVALRALKQKQKQQYQAADIAKNKQQIDAQKFCQNISRQLPCDLITQEEKAWGELLHHDYTDSELLQLYSRQVLSKVDHKALAEVAKFSTESVVFIALSPIAIVDMALMFWRNIRMINKIAGLYGLKLGYWSRIRLIKQIFVNMLYAGASELVADFGMDLLGADLLGKLSGRLAQGLGAGMLTARLGLRTIDYCRPIPFGQDAPKLSQVRMEILTQVKKLLKK